MRNDGKNLERLVRLIQEALKDSPYTTIKSNYKIENISGSKREIDIYIESKINDFIIRIAIECKEYSRPISVDKIEAFNSKCQLIPGINKKVFVSQSSYQSGAIDSAKYFGIDIYDVSSIDSEIVLGWLPIKQLGLRFEILNYKLSVESLEFAGKTYVSENKIYFSNAESIDITEFVTSIIIENKKDLWGINLLKFMQNSKEQVDAKIKSNFQIDLEDAYIINEKNQKIVITQIKGNTESWLVESSPKILESNSFGLSKREPVANQIAFDIGADLKPEIVFTKDNYKMFLTNEKGESSEMVLLGTFDPKTNTYTVNKN